MFRYLKVGIKFQVQEAAHHKAVPLGITTKSFKHWDLRLLV